MNDPKAHEKMLNIISDQRNTTKPQWDNISYPLGSPREGNGTPLQYSCLENPMDRGAWWAAVHGVATSGTRLINFTFTFHFHALEEEMATHSSVLAWRIPGMGEPGGPPSMGSHRVGHDWSELAVAAVAILTSYSSKKWLFILCWILLTFSHHSLSFAYFFLSAKSDLFYYRYL